MQNIAHRGWSAVYPENTILSFEKALELGVTHLELDLQITFDGHLVVMHDRSVDRTTDGSGEVSDLTLAEIKELDAGVHKDAVFAGNRVPTYQEVLEGLSTPATLVTELKFSGNEGIRKTIDQIRSSDATHRVIISSFELDKLPIVKDLAPELPTTALVPIAGRSVQHCIDLAREFRIDTFGPRASDVTPELVEGLHDAGLRVRAWGLGQDQGEELRRMVACGVDGMTTDCPDILQRILQEQDE